MSGRDEDGGLRAFVCGTLTLAALSALACLSTCWGRT